MPSLANQAKKVTQELLELLNVPVNKISASSQSQAANDDEAILVVNIDTPEEESGILIGYHGETLGAFQYLIGQLVNKGQEKWTRLTVNVNDYRSQREAQLKQMAQTAADRAVSTGDEIEMPFLTSAERRVIHLSLQDRDEVTTYSEGENRNRRLIVAPAPSQRNTSRASNEGKASGK